MFISPEIEKTAFNRTFRYKKTASPLTVQAKETRRTGQSNRRKKRQEVSL